MCMPIYMHHVHIIIYDGISIVLILSLFFIISLMQYICISIHAIQYMYIYIHIMTLNPYLLVDLFHN